MTRVVRAALAVALLCPLPVKAGTIEDLYQAQTKRERMEADNALNRAGGWLVLAGVALAGNIYYAHRSQKAGHEAQAYRDAAGSHGGVTFLSYQHRPQDPNPPQPIMTVIDLGPARNLEKRSEVYKNRADYFLVATALFGVLTAINVNRFISIRASMDGGSVVAEKRF